MVNYQLKAQVMSLGYDKLERKVSKAFYSDYILHRWGEVINSKFSYDKALSINEDMIANCPEEWKEAQRVNKAYYDRVKRLKDKIATMLNNGKCVFLTFTFTDKVLQKTKTDTRRQKVRRFLTSLNCNYVANVDYGAKKGREHYHAIAQVDKVDFKKWTYGALNGQTVHSTNDNVKLAKYISKLTNHAIKDTTKGNRALYNKKQF